MSTDSHVTELIPAYTLGCLDEEEARMVAHHLSGCAGCRAELASYQAVAGQLALALPEKQPPPELKQRLMARVQSSSTKTAGTDSSPSPWQKIMAAIQNILALPLWRPVALLFIVGLLISNTLLWWQLNQRAATAPGNFGAVPLYSPDATLEASGIVIISADGQHGTLVVQDLPVLDETRQYQLWLLRDGERTNGGAFTVGEDGYASKWVGGLPWPLGDYTAFAITIEPAGSEPTQPGGRQVLTGESQF